MYKEFETKKDWAIFVNKFFSAATSLANASAVKEIINGPVSQLVNRSQGIEIKFNGNIDADPLIMEVKKMHQKLMMLYDGEINDPLEDEAANGEH